MNTYRLLIKTTVGTLVFAGFLFQITTSTKAVTTISTSTETRATQHSIDRKVWFDGSRYWASFDEGSDIEFWHSTDGSSWTQNTSATITNERYQYSIYGDGSQAYYVRQEGLDIVGASASSYPGTGFSWSSESTIFDGTGTSDRYFSPHIARDTNGNLWVLALYSDGTNYSWVAAQSTNTDDITAWDASTTLDSSATNTDFGAIVPLNAGDMYAVFANNGTTLKGCFYDEQTSDAWEDSSGNSCANGTNQDTITTGADQANVSTWSVTADTTDYDVHIDLREDSNEEIGYIRWDNSSGTNGAWQSIVSGIIPDENDTTIAAWADISVDTATKDIYVIGVNEGINIWYSFCDYSAASSECDVIGDWSTATDVGDLTTADNTYVNSNLANDGRIFAIWKDESSSPYDVEFHSFLEPTGLDPADHTMTFTISSVAADNVNNEITTSEASTFNSLPFGHLTFNTPKYVAHQLSVTTNAPGGYNVTAKLLNTLQGNYPANVIDPFVASWGSPTTWTQPTGTTANVQTAWFGANTTDTDVSGWNSSPQQKFGGIGTTSINVMESPDADEAGSNVTVTYVIEANQFHPPDLYAGTLVYNLTPTY